MKLFHLVPLNWSDSEIWIAKAKLAIEFGYSPSVISEAVHGFPISRTAWIGNQSIERKNWLDELNKLCLHPDTGIQTIGQAGRIPVQQELEEALRREKLEEIYNFRKSRTLRRN